MSSWHRHHATGVHVESSNGSGAHLQGELCCCCGWDLQSQSPTFNRSSRFVTIGSVRYGVRVGAVSPPPPGARYRATAGLLHQHRRDYREHHDHRDQRDYDGADDDCCCGVVNLPWPRSVACVSRIPLLVDKQQPPINRCGIFNSVNSEDMPNGFAGCTPSALLESEPVREAQPEAVLEPELQPESVSQVSPVLPVFVSSSPGDLSVASGSPVSLSGGRPKPAWSSQSSRAGPLATNVLTDRPSPPPSAAQLYLQNQLRRRVLVRSQSDATSYVKLHEVLDGPTARRGTLDRLHRFRFGGNRTTSKERDASAPGGGGANGGGGASSRAKKTTRSDDKVEKLRELTDRLKGASSSNKYVPQQTYHHPHQSALGDASDGACVGGRVFCPVPPPRNKHSAQTQTQAQSRPYLVQTAPVITSTPSIPVASAPTTVQSAIPSVPPPETSQSPSTSPTLPPPPPPLPTQPTTADALTFVNLQLPKPEARTLVGSYIQRSIPFRSASFSQVDYSSSDGKYFRKCNVESSAGAAGAAFTLPRKRDAPQKCQEQETPRLLTATEVTTTGPRDSLHSEASETSDAATVTDTDQEVHRLFEMISQNTNAFSLNILDDAIEDSPTEASGPQNTIDSNSVLTTTPAAPSTDANVNERQCSFLSNSEEKKRDRSRRRKGMYISQWPDQRASVLLACSQNEVPSSTGATASEGDRDSLCSMTVPKLQTDDATPASPADDATKKPDWNVRTVFGGQSFDEKDPTIQGRTPSSRFKYFNRTDSLSEGESEQMERRPVTPNREHLNSPLLSPSDVSDSESRASIGNDSLSPHMPRRYSKRPLRGPYGQMLEAEMKKPETNRIFNKHHLNHDLKFLDELSNNPVNQRSSSPNMTTSMISLSSSNSVGHGDPKPKFVMRSRGPSNHSLDDSSLKNSFNTALGAKSSVTGRKGASETPMSAPIGAFGDTSDPAHHRLFVCHQRTTSSPSKLEEIVIPSQNERAASAEPSTQLLRDLLQGSSEQLAIASASETSSASGPRTSAALGSHSINQDDTRTHIVVELYETERSYVESLQILVMKYLEPLKSPENSGLLDAAQVDEIFYQVPTLLSHHQIFLEELRKRLEHWDSKQKVGDVFLDFMKPTVVETYTAFINNWKRAKEVIKTTSQAKAAFARFLEAMAREHKGKLALDSLLIKPIQKFPKYELLIQRLIKHTDSAHPDYQLLLDAQREVHDNLIKINCTERETLEFEQQQQNLKELEGLVEGLVNLVAADRTYLRHDLVTMTAGQGARKERALFMFSDLLIVTSIKRRSGTIRKPSGNCSSSVTSTLDANKYKLLMRIPLEDLEVMKTKDESVRRVINEIENLNEDLAVMNQINELMWSLHCPHTQLEEVVRDMLSSLNRQLTEQQNSDSQLSYLELMLNTPNGIEYLSIVFSQSEKRASWEESFNEAKHKLALSADRQPCPEFVAPVPIRKTRAGLQFTCAAPTLTNTSNSSKDVWVCNSDGYVGQVCVLSLYPEPTVTSCNGVCNARILCVASIPAGITNMSVTRNTTRKGTHVIDDDDDRRSANIQFDSSSSSEEEEDSDREDFTENKRRGTPAERGKSAETASTDSSDDTDNLQPTMWLGTEDGCIHVYNCNDNIRIKKNKIRLQHGSSIQCIIYLDNRVFVSLANGDITIYTREPSSWNTSAPLTISVGTALTPVTKMLPNNGKLWCSCSNIIKIFNIQSLSVEHSFQANSDPNKPLTCMVMSGLGVWISLQNSAVIKCFHSVSYELLCEVNVAPAVTKMLTSCDDIIRQHKAACLRVTSLLACKDLLWIGTSAGVLLTMPLPHITSTTNKISVLPTINGVPHGHTGHVRFLTCIEGSSVNATSDSPSSQYLCRTIPDGSTNSKLLIISGGDGYEDFRNSNVSEIAGREDSTNHLLLWHV